jgi:hypothetical protein
LSSASQPPSKRAFAQGSQPILVNKQGQPLRLPFLCYDFRPFAIKALFCQEITFSLLRYATISVFSVLTEMKQAAAGSLPAQRKWEQPLPYSSSAVRAQPLRHLSK